MGTLVIKRIYRGKAEAPPLTARDYLQRKQGELKERIKQYPIYMSGRRRSGIVLDAFPGKWKDRAAKDHIPQLPCKQMAAAIPRWRWFEQDLFGCAPPLLSPTNRAVIARYLDHLTRTEQTLHLPRNRSESLLITQAVVLPSHTAENLFWVGRYTERLLGNARFHRT
jgi:hypothetical protein